MMQEIKDLYEQGLTCLEIFRILNKKYSEVQIEESLVHFLLKEEEVIDL